MIRCDVDGIPKLVQSISYHHGLHYFELLNGNEVCLHLDEEDMYASPESPDTMHYAEHILLKTPINRLISQDINQNIPNPVYPNY